MTTSITATEFTRREAEGQPPASNEDRRQFPRRDGSWSAQLVCHEGDTPRVCSVRDLGEGGLGAALPALHPPRIGQRFEIVTDPNENANRLAIPEGCFATVVRINRLVDGDAEVRVGLRFDYPIFV